MLILTIDDNTARIDIAIFQELLELYEPLLNKDVVLVVEGEISNDDFNGGIKMVAKKIFTMEQAREFYKKKINVVLTSTDKANVLIIKEIVKSFPGDIPVVFTYCNSQLELNVNVNNQYNVALSDPLIFQLKKVLGPEAVILV